MNAIKITPLILTYNETANIGRVLDHLTSFDEIVVIDSFSEDNTVEIIEQYQNTTCLQRKFDSHTAQWNFGLSKVNTEWVLSLDADYIIKENLLQELITLDLVNTQFSAFNLSFKYCINGHPLKGTILPPRIALFNKHKSNYYQDGHTQMLQTDGPIGHLTNPILHDDRKPLDQWLLAQSKYVNLERDKLLSTPYKALSLADKIRTKKYFAPIIILIYCLILKKGIWDGKKGWYYAYQRMYFEVLLSLKLMEHKQ